MSIEQLKELFGSQEAILELVQLESGELALRNAGSEKQPLVIIQFNDEVKALLGDQTPATRIPPLEAKSLKLNVSAAFMLTSPLC